MEYRPLGRTGVQVSQLCLGTMMFGGKTEEPESARMIDHAIEHCRQHFHIRHRCIGGIGTTKRNSQAANDDYRLKCLRHYTSSLRYCIGPPLNGAKPVPKITPASSRSSSSTIPSAEADRHSARKGFMSRSAS